MIIGVTGGIGAGKSVVSRLLREMGYPVYDCDYEAKQLMDASLELHREIAETLGEDCLLDTGALCRPNIAKRVFADSEARKWLNSRVHAMVRTDLTRWIEAHRESPLIFVESAIMKTSGLDRMMDRVWIVDAPETLRILRASSRDGANPGEIMARMETQREELENLSAPVGIIENDEDSLLIPQILNQIKELC